MLQKHSFLTNKDNSFVKYLLLLFVVIEYITRVFQANLFVIYHK